MDTGQTDNPAKSKVLRKLDKLRKSNHVNARIAPI